MKPTVACRVWLWPVRNTHPPFPGRVIDEGQPFMADITFVHPDGRVNLSYRDHMGNDWDRERVFFKVGEIPKDFPEYCYAAWPDSSFPQGASAFEDIACGAKSAIE